MPRNRKSKSETQEHKQTFNRQKPYIRTHNRLVFHWKHPNKPKKTKKERTKYLGSAKWNETSNDLIDSILWVTTNLNVDVWHFRCTGTNKIKQENPNENSHCFEKEHK